MKTTHQFISALLAIASVSACSLPATDKWDKALTEADYQALKNEPVAQKNISFQGIDLWTTGLPNKKYSVLGAVTDKRRVVGFNQTAYQQDIVSYIKEAGGDGGIILNSESKVIDTVAQGCGASPGNSSSYRCNNFSAFYSPNIEGTDGTLEYRISHIVIIRYVR